MLITISPVWALKTTFWRSSSSWSTLRSWCRSWQLHSLFIFQYFHFQYFQYFLTEFIKLEHIEIMMQKLTAALCLKYLTEIKNILRNHLYLVFVGISFIICLFLFMIFFYKKNFWFKLFSSNNNISFSQENLKSDSFLSPSLGPRESF